MTRLASGIFVTGTDTGVGKTTISTVLIEALVAQGKKVAVMKPVESGCAPIRNGDGVANQDGDSVAGELFAADGEALRAVSNCGQKAEEVVLYRYKNPLAPAVAERLEGVPISLEEILAHVENQRQGRDYLVVEGAGGLLVPIHGTYSYADLAEEAQLGTLVVVGSRLGAINHAALTFEVLRARRLPVIGYVLSEPHPREVGLGVYTAAETNREIIQRVAARYDVKELGVFPHLSHLSAISGSTVPVSTVTGQVSSGAALNGKGNVVEEERGVIKQEGARLIEGIESFFS